MDKEKFKEGFFHIFKAAGYSLAGLAAGSIAMESSETINPLMSDAALRGRMR